MLDPIGACMRLVREAGINHLSGPGIVLTVLLLVLLVAAVVFAALALLLFVGLLP